MARRPEVAARKDVGLGPLGTGRLRAQACKTPRRWGRNASQGREGMCRRSFVSSCEVGDPELLPNAAGGSSLFQPACHHADCPAGPRLNRTSPCPPQPRRRTRPRQLHPRRLHGPDGVRTPLMGGGKSHRGSDQRRRSRPREERPFPSSLARGGEPAWCRRRRLPPRWG
jgi:hypothetical protein